MTQHVPVVANVDNLICPASFNLGTHKPVLAASVPEGDDKPYNILASIAVWMHWSSTRLTCCHTSHSKWITSNAACKCSTLASPPSHSRAPQAQAWTRG